MKNQPSFKWKSVQSQSFKSIEEVKNYLQVYINENLKLNNWDWTQNPNMPIYDYELDYYLQKSSKSKLFIPWNINGKFVIFDYNWSLTNIWKIIFSDKILNRISESRIEDITISMLNAYNWSLALWNAESLVFNEYFFLLSQNPIDIEQLKSIIWTEYKNNKKWVFLIINVPNSDKYLLFQIKNKWKNLSINYSTNKTQQDLNNVFS